MASGIRKSSVYYCKTIVCSISLSNSEALSLAFIKQFFIISGSQTDPPLLCTYKMVPSVSNIMLTISLERLSSLSFGSDNVTLGFAKTQKVDDTGKRCNVSGRVC